MLNLHVLKNMNLPSDLRDWLQYKYENDCETIYSTESISHEFKKSTGGMIMYAGLSLRIEPSESFVLSFLDSEVEETYELAVKDGIISSLFKLSDKPLLKIKVTVSDMKSTLHGSSYFAFYSVAKEAMAKVYDELYT